MSGISNASSGTAVQPKTKTRKKLARLETLPARRVFQLRNDHPRLSGEQLVAAHECIHDGGAQNI